MNSKDHMRAAFTALLLGDLAERDRQCELAKQAIDKEDADEARLRTIAPTDPINPQ